MLGIFGRPATKEEERLRKKEKLKVEAKSKGEIIRKLIREKVTKKSKKRRG